MQSLLRIPDDIGNVSLPCSNRSGFVRRRPGRQNMGQNNRGESARVFEPTPASKWSGGCARIVAAQWSERSIVDPRLSSNTPCDLVPLQSGSPPLPCSAGAIVSMVPVAAELPTVDGRPHTNPVNRPCVRTMKRLEPPRFGFSKAANASGSVRLLELHVAQPCTIAVVGMFEHTFYATSGLRGVIQPWDGNISRIL